MKKIIFIMVAVFMSVGMVMAQGKGPKGGKQDNVDPKVRAERMTERMAKDLGLNDTQKQKLLQLNLADWQTKADCKAKPAEGDNSAQMTKEERQKVREQRQACRAEYDAKLQKILTPEQYTKYTQLKAEREKNKKENNQRSGDRPQKRNK